MLKSLFAAIAFFFASIFGGHHVQSVSVPVHTQPAAAAAAAVAQSADPFPAASTSTPVATSSPSTPTTTIIIKKYITQPVVERIIQSPRMQSGLVLGANAIGEDTIDQKLAALKSDILSHQLQPVFVPRFTGPAAQKTAVMNYSG